MHVFYVLRISILYLTCKWFAADKPSNERISYYILESGQNQDLPGIGYLCVLTEIHHFYDVP